MDIINELELRRILKKRQTGNKFTGALIKKILDESLPWEEKRAFWHFLFNSGRIEILAHTLTQALKGKARIPFDLFVQICTHAGLKPKSTVVASVLKGARKQAATDELIGPRGWDRFDTRFQQIRTHLLKQKTSEQKHFKDGLLEKFEFLQSQRMTEQAGRVLRRMVELYPEDIQFRKLKDNFEEQWARDVLSTHMAALSSEKLDRTLTAPSTSDQEMLKCFATEGEKISLEHREFAADLAIGFWFLEDYSKALESLAWAAPSLASDWMKAELLFESRRFIECIELLNVLEVKYIEDPESTFSVSYLRAQCLYLCGQQAAGLEMLQSIARVRPNYRSASALILQWTEGAPWE
ncbi:MAG: hypothetical protein KF799_09745 [Bdellovibrionales bacterium]|nr:hypothetical protein [Bdellovibrionales bacterium]